MAKMKSGLVGETKIKVVMARLSFPYLFAPRKNDDGTDDKYQCCLLIDQKDTAFKEAYDKALEAAKANGVKSKWGGKMPKNLQLPLRDGEEREEEYPEFEGKWFLNPKARRKPDTCVVVNGGQLAKTDDEEEFYAGCYVVALVSLFPYDNSGNKGVACGLEGIIKVKDGERFDGGASIQSALADEDFSEFADDDEEDDM